MDKKRGLIIDSNGTKRWYCDDKLHRVDGPAIESANGAKVWYRDGKYHRVDGPAIEYYDGTKAWYIDGVKYTFSEWIKVSKLSKDEISELVLYYG